MDYVIGPSLHNNKVQSFYYATNNWATCFDTPGPSSNNGVNQGICGNTTNGIPRFTVSLYIKIQYVIKWHKNDIITLYFNVQRNCKPRDTVGSVTAYALVNIIIL